MTVRDIFEKVEKINEAIDTVEGRIDSYGKQYPGQEPLYGVIDLLKEYRTRLLDTKING